MFLFPSELFQKIISSDILPGKAEKAGKQQKTDC